MDILYVESGYLEPGYLVYTANAQASLSSAAYMPPEGYIVDGYVDPDYYPVTVFEATRLKGSPASLTVVVTTTVSGVRSIGVQANLVSTSTVAVSTVRIKQSGAVLSTTASLTGTGRKTLSGQATLSSTAQLAVSASRNRSSAISLEAFGNSSIQAFAGKVGVGTFSTTANMQTSASITRDAGAATRVLTWDNQDLSWDDWYGIYWDPTQGIWLEPRFGLQAVARATGTGFVNFQSDFAVVPNGGLVLEESATITAAAALSAQGGFEKSANSNITATFTTTAAGSVQRASGGAALNATATIAVEGTASPPIRDNPTLLVQSSVVAVAGQLQSAQATLDSEFSLVGTPRQPGLQQAQATLTSVAAITAQPGLEISGVAILSTRATINVSAVKTAVGISNFTITTAQTTVPTRVRPGISSMNSAVNVATAFTRIRPGTGNLLVESTIVPNGGFTASGDVDIAARFAVVPNGGILLGGVSRMQVSGFVLTVGDVIWWDADHVLTVPPETRQYLVLPDVRTLYTSEETRVNTVLPEERTLEVPEETRTLQVIA